MVEFCKKRQQRDSLYAFGEGDTECAFLIYLKNLYSRDKNISIKIKDLHGGSIKDMVEKAIRINLHDNRDKLFVILDVEPVKGIVIDDEVSQQAKENNLEIIDFKPCVESLFLLILGKVKDSILFMSSEQCKKEFEKKYLDAHKKLNFLEYEKIFPKDLLEQKRKEITELDTIIKYMENK